MTSQPGDASLALPAPLSHRDLLLRPILLRVLALVAVMLLAQAG